ncbi:hypothetical protein AAU57_12090 [Nonlabens sp. YIK11]|uniref:hypothetical protein n=1 Tax=Nonlabens sp. YIK11 TaxID=1453349 RepID=UPI0006DD2F06|nr:hypothetical protein [Nonlabens sp. YIK11]KQC33988.1 hypothetical protein AAU57_12090 [Nonlabens sp. YIK11]
MANIENINGYELSKNWFNWSFENPDKVKPIHTAIYFFAIQQCNSLGWKEKFGFPSQVAMDALGIRNWKTYSKGLNDLVDFGFIEMIESSKNQHTSNIISLSGAYVKNTKALTKATSKHSTKQVQSTPQSIASIDKPITKNQEDDVEPSSTKDDSFKHDNTQKISIQKWRDTYLKDETLLKAVLSNKRNKFHGLEDLKNKMQDFVSIRIETSKSVSDFQEFCKHFRDWAKYQDNSLEKAVDKNNINIGYAELADREEQEYFAKYANS